MPRNDTIDAILGEIVLPQSFLNVSLPHKKDCGNHYLPLNVFFRFDALSSVVSRINRSNTIDRLFQRAY